jgi:putative transposase
MAKASRKDAPMTPTVSPRVPLTPRQRTCLEQMLRRQTSPQRLVRRAKMLLALDTGAKACHVMRQRPLNRGTVGVWRQRGLAFAPKRAQLEADEGRDKTLCPMIVEALTDPPRPGPPATFTAEQLVQLVAVAWEAPADSGRPVSPWTPREGAAEVRQRGLVATLRTRRVGRFVQSGRLTAPSSGILAQRQAG